LTQAVQYFSGQQVCVYLVGGSLRNLLLGEQCVDWDLVTDGEAHKLARGLADQLGGFYVYLHEKASRVVLRSTDAATDLFLDIAPQHGETIEDDLRTRDFTLNALAAPLGLVVEQLLRSGSLDAPEFSLIDPLGGQAAIRSRLVQATDPETFRHDPLRMLRALRLAGRYALTLDQQTEALIRRDAPLLTQVAAERIHEELSTILAFPDPLEQLHHLDKYGLLTVLIPELIPARDMRQPAPHYWDVLEHSLQCVHYLTDLALAFQMNPQDPLWIDLAVTPAASEDLAVIGLLIQEAEQQQLFSLADLLTSRIKLAALLHDIGKPLTRTIDEQGAIHFYNHPQAGAPLASRIMHRLCAPTQDRRLVQLVTAHHMRPGQLGQGPGAVVTQRAIRRYFLDLGPTGIFVAIFSLADHLATLGPQPRTAAWARHLSVVRLLLASYIRERETLLPPRMVRAEELMSRLKLTSGPLIGTLLELIAEAQADGLIHSREEAIILAQEYISRQ
jgi:poly(A) polymerase